MLKRLKLFVRAHPDLSMIILVLAVIGAAQLLLGSRPSPIESVEALQVHLSAGEPTVVEFYSNL